VTGSGGCPLIAREFSHVCGEDAGEVLVTLYTFLRALAYAGERRLEVGYPGYAALTIDERQMLALIGAAQTGHAGLLDAHLCNLAGAPVRPALAIATCGMGTALDAHDLRPPRPVVNSGVAYCGPFT